VFTSEAGAELLSEWRKSHVLARTFNVEPLRMAKAAANKDFVTDIESIIQEVKNWK
jgi:hypothetical protein